MHKVCSQHASALVSVQSLASYQCCRLHVTYLKYFFMKLTKLLQTQYASTVLGLSKYPCCYEIYRYSVCPW